MFLYGLVIRKKGDCDALESSLYIFVLLYLQAYNSNALLRVY